MKNEKFRFGPSSRYQPAMAAPFPVTADKVREPPTPPERWQQSSWDGWDTTLAGISSPKRMPRALFVTETTGVQTLRREGARARLAWVQVYEKKAWYTRYGSSKVTLLFRIFNDILTKNLYYNSISFLVIILTKKNTYREQFEQIISFKFSHGETNVLRTSVDVRFSVPRCMFLGGT